MRDLPPAAPAMTTALSLEAELAGEERAVRHLIGERAAITSKIQRAQAQEQLLNARLHAQTTRQHPAVRQPAPGLPHGLRFPDISSYQPNVDWGAVSGAHSVRVGELGMVKLTEGVGWVDALGARRWRAMAAQHLPHRGGYHYLHAGENPVEQAHNLLGALQRAGVEIRASDILACDLEVSDGQPPQTIRACAREFATELRKHSPAKQWLYTGGPFAREFELTLDGYDAHWLPAYVGDPRPFMIFGRQTIAWQYTDGHYGPVPHLCPGIGACDLSILL